MSEACEIPLKNAPEEEVRQILSDAKVLAIVGLSDKPERDSYRVAGYLQANGYRIIPVNPNVTEVLGEKAYPSLRDLPEDVDTVVIFRRVQAVPGIVDDAVAIGTKVLWMQERIVHNASADKARDAGLQVVMNKCMMKEHRAAFGGGEKQ